MAVSGGWNESRIVSITESNKTRVYLSCVIKELRTFRDTVEEVLRTLGGEVVTTDIWGLEEEDLGSEIREKIEGCGIFVQLLGSSFGPEFPGNQDELSYLKFEYSCAKSAGNKIHLIALGPDCDRDQPAEVVDRPIEISDQSVAERLVKKRRNLQAGYLRELKLSGEKLHQAKSNDEARDAIFEIWSRPDEMRQRYLQRNSSSKKRTRIHAGLAAGLLVTLLAAVGLVTMSPWKSKPEEAAANVKPAIVDEAALDRIESALIARADNGLKDTVGKGFFVLDVGTYREKEEVMIYRDRCRTIEQFMGKVRGKLQSEVLTDYSKEIFALMLDDLTRPVSTRLSSKDEKKLLAGLAAGVPGPEVEAARSIFVDMIGLAQSEGNLDEARRLADLAVEADPGWRDALIVRGRIELSRAHVARRDKDRKEFESLLRSSAAMANDLVAINHPEPDALKLKILVDLNLANDFLSIEGKHPSPERPFEDFKKVEEQISDYRAKYPDDLDGGILIMDCLSRRAKRWVYGEGEVPFNRNNDNHLYAAAKLDQLADKLRIERCCLRAEVDLFTSWYEFPDQISPLTGSYTGDPKHLHRAARAALRWVNEYPDDFEGILSLINLKIRLGNAFIRNGRFDSYQAEQNYRAAWSFARTYREQNPNDLVALNLYCRSSVRLGECLLKLGSSGKSGPAFPVFKEALELSSVAYLDNPSNGFAAFGYLLSLGGMADYLEQSGELADLMEGHKYACRSVRVALDYLPENPGEIFVGLFLENAFDRVGRARSIVKDLELVNELEEELMKTVRGLINDNRKVNGLVLTLYEELNLKKK